MRARGSLVALLAALLWVAGALGAPAAAPAGTVQPPDAPVQEAPPEEDVAAPAEVPAPPEVTARGAVLWDPADDLVLHGVEEHIGRPMASTTKIMTVLLALEAGAIDDELTVSSAAAGLGGATLGLRAGQVLPVRSIVAGLLLRSGNDAALALAEHLAGSEPAFVERMNARARELGLTATAFVNASGLTDDPAHHASPLDLARLASVAMAHPDFAQYAGAVEVTVPGLAPMVSRNELLTLYPGATGVKTGFTTLAGNCLVASAEREGRTLYAVVLGSEHSFADAAALLDYGFANWRRAEALPADATVAAYRWAGAEVDLVTDGPLVATVAAAAQVTWRARIAPAAPLPLRAGDELGTVEMLVDGEVHRAVPLRAAADADRPAPASAAATVGTGIQDALRTFTRLQPLEEAA